MFLKSEILFEDMLIVVDSMKIPSKNIPPTESVEQMEEITNVRIVSDFLLNLTGC